MGAIIKTYFPSQPVFTMLIAATLMALAAIAMIGFRERAENAVDGQRPAGDQPLHEPR